jgi:GntR family transcriptional regulator, transcriptional repressor for pyruvate dehydrogenase complex
LPAYFLLTDRRIQAVTFPRKLPRTVGRTLDTIAVKQGPLPQAIAAELRRRIARGELKPGERLPGQRELAAGFSVSVGTVREAISMLVSAGLIETKAARGTFVVESLELRAPGELPLERREAEELLEARRLLELQIATLATRRRTRAQLERMRSAVVRMGGAGENSRAYVDADIAFHLSVADAAGNRFLRRALEDLWLRLRGDMEVSAETAIRRFGSLGFSVGAHDDLIDAIEAGDDERARALAAALMEGSHEFVLGLYALSAGAEAVPPVVA